MQYLDILMHQIKSNPDVMSIIMQNATPKEESHRLDNIQEAFREVEYWKAGIENKGFKNAYRRDSSDEDIIKNLKSNPRFDANEGLIFARALEEIDPTRYEVIHRPLNEWKDLLPVRTFQPGTDRITYRQFDHIGEAILSAPGNITDVPMADAEATEYSNDVYSWATGYMYTAQELRRAAKAGLSLSMEKIMAVERAFQTKIQKTMMEGVSQIGLKGLINATGVNTQAAAPGAGTDRTWIGGDKTNDEIIYDITGLGSSAIRTRTYGQYGVSGLYVGLSQERYDYIANTRMASGTDTTIMQFILNNRESNGIERFVIIRDLTDAGTSSSQLMIIYPKTNEVLEANIVESIQWMPMQTRGLSFVFNGEMEFGGVTIRYPVAMQQVYGI